MTDQPSPRRRFQFRLRTLMIVVTLMAVACWVVVDRQRLMHERDDAVKLHLRDAAMVETYRQTADRAIRELEAHKANIAPKK